MNEQIFFETLTKEKEWCTSYCYLLNYFFSSYHSVEDMRNILQYIRSIKASEIKIDDWNSFEWRGVVCFRKEYVMIIDEKVFEVGNKLPGLKNEDGSNLLNASYEWIIDTDYIENNYSQFIKIPIDEFDSITCQWIAFLEGKV
ncbi:MAG TPA: hypothetical protein VIM75_18320 [Ohtaekwangia sp.]|uniref:hypothetical protein n=1 Tax=Ohtaekwangia sp. TaxID=2066019 RepID=UPI002F95620A